MAGMLRGCAILVGALVLASCGSSRTFRHRQEADFPAAWDPAVAAVREAHPLPLLPYGYGPVYHVERLDADRQLVRVRFRCWKIAFQGHPIEAEECSYVVHARGGVEVRHESASVWGAGMVQSPGPDFLGVPLPPELPPAPVIVEHEGPWRLGLIAVAPRDEAAGPADPVDRR